jgi:hypothetical protein
MMNAFGSLLHMLSLQMPLRDICCNANAVLSMAPSLENRQLHAVQNRYILPTSLEPSYTAIKSLFPQGQHHISPRQAVCYLLPFTSLPTLLTNAQYSLDPLSYILTHILTENSQNADAWLFYPRQRQSRRRFVYRGHWIGCWPPRLQRFSGNECACGCCGK